MRYVLIGIFVLLTIVGQALPSGLLHDTYTRVFDTRYSASVQGVDYNDLKGTRFYDIKVQADAVDAHTKCYADFRGPNKALGTVTVLDVTYERGFIMGKYHIKEQGGRWFYQQHFENFRCLPEDKI